MDDHLISLLLTLAIIGCFWVAPIISIANSYKTTRNEKIAWILAVIFISWFAWIFYLLLAPIKKEE
jgi:small neutral amino acid transporter SnatA (MarC family)